MLVYLKGYNYKLCRKGLLERGLSVGKSFGNFKNIENEYLSKIPMQNTNGVKENTNGVKEIISELKKRKLDETKKEIRKLEIELQNLDKTIKNKKKEIRQKTDDFTYIKWSQFINDSGLKFKILFSDECNDLYNHLYQNDGKLEKKTLLNIASNIGNINNEIIIEKMKKDLQKEFLNPNIEDDLLKNFLNSSGGMDNERNDSGFIDSKDESGFNGSNEMKQNEQKPLEKKRKRKTVDYETVDEIGVVEMEVFEGNIKKYLK